jgi:AcrR family transcriptional regulator
MSKDKPSTERSRGRPVSIDKMSVLDAAVLTFWERGYEGASLTDLTQAMKISRPSLYSGFGGKADLFDAALVRYAQTIGSAPLVAFEAERDIYKAVQTFLSASAKGNRHADYPRGCLIVCCASTTAETAPKVRERLEHLYLELQKRLIKRFDVETGLPVHISSLQRAVMMIDLVHGQAIRARVGWTKEELLKDLDIRTRSVLGLG